ncbi:hypothetical protein AB0F72_08795 [Actinoplanes sp. NPDC023936]|uniref:hypothetical protein n=1 Tax=Actinoplanes sp. NPDC023936 TaxID=3154910 RepID=UPI0033C29B96
MEQDTSSKLSVDEIHERMGMTVTEEGKARARRRRLESAAAHHDPEANAAFLASLRTRTA